MPVELNILNLNKASGEQTVELLNGAMDPQVVIFNHWNNDGTYWSSCWGVGIESTSRFAVANKSSDGIAITDTKRWSHSDRCMGIINPFGTDMLKEVDYIGHAKGKFTLYINKATTLTHTCHYWAFSGLKNYKLKAETTGTSSGNKSFTGYGFKPNLLFIWGVNQIQSNGTISDNAHFAMGVTDGLKQGTTGYFSLHGWPTGDQCFCTHFTNRMFTMMGVNKSATHLDSAILVGFDSDGFTWTLTKSGTVNAEFFVLAMEVGGAYVNTTQVPSAPQEVLHGTSTFKPEGAFIFCADSDTQNFTKDGLSQNYGLVGAGFGGGAQGRFTQYQQQFNTTITIDTHQFQGSNAALDIRKDTAVQDAVGAFPKFNDLGLEVNWTLANGDQEYITYAFVKTGIILDPVPMSMAFHRDGPFTFTMKTNEKPAPIAMSMSIPAFTVTSAFNVKPTPVPMSMGTSTIPIQMSPVSMSMAAPAFTVKTTFNSNTFAPVATSMFAVEPDGCGDVPVAPTGLTAAAIAQTIIFLQWTDNSSSEDNYIVQRSLDGSTWANIATLPANTTQFVDVGLTTGTLYYYRVRAREGGYDSCATNVATATTESNMDSIMRFDAALVKHVKSSLFTGVWASADTVTVTINTKTITFTAADASIPNIIDGLVLLLAASTAPPEFGEITWTRSTNTLVGTAKTGGNFIDFRMSEVTAGSGAAADPPTEATANDGLQALTAANVDTATLPGAGDTLTFENADEDLKYQIDALGLNTLAALYIEASYVGECGLPRRNEDGTVYYEYRERYLKGQFTEVVIGDGDGDGSGRIMLDLLTVQSNVIVRKTGDAAEDGFHALRLKGTHASNALEAHGDCTIDIAPEGNDVATFLTIDASGNAVVRISRRVTVGTLTVTGGAVVYIDSDTALTDITAILIGGGGTVVFTGDNLITAVTITEQGQFDDRGEGTITTLKQGPESSYTTEESTVGKGNRTITTCILTAGCSHQNGNQTAVYTNPVDLGLSGLKDFQDLDLGYDIDLAVS